MVETSNLYSFLAVAEELSFTAAARRLHNASDAPAPHERIEGLENFDKVIDIDQSPIGRTPRSNPATYTGAFQPIRDWLAGRGPALQCERATAGRAGAAADS